ncbi:MAG: DNA polymerase IV [Bacteroidetes bacterium]|nr:DNA polymerase IV [Bacteroidota bacterium]
MKKPQRYIAHYDLDSFFVSVEILNNPLLKNKPVLVGGKEGRGVVAACSYAARKFGIHSAMPMQKAMLLCPQAIVCPGDYASYARYSQWVTDMILAKAPLVEKASIDEFYLDLTGMDLFFDVLQWCVMLRKEIIEETGLPISFGLGTNKLIAKMATNEAKPNGFLFVQPGEEKKFLAPLPISKIPGAGKHTTEVLKSMGLLMIRDVQQKPVNDLEDSLGKYGLDLWEKAQGIHTGEVHPMQVSKSVSTENTFHENITDETLLLSHLVRMTEKICFQLRKKKLMSGCVAVKIRYANFETTTMQVAMDFTCLDDEIIPIAIQLFHKHYRKRNEVRLLGVRLSNLRPHIRNANLFDDGEKKSKLYGAIDSVKKQFGSTSLQKARALKK